MKKILITLLLNIFVTACVIGSLMIYAQHAYPASALYTLKRLGENITMSFQLSNEAKANYYIDLAKKRKTEVNQVYLEEQYQHILITSLRYVATTGNATEYILQNDLKPQGSQLKKMMQEDIVEFAKMSVNLPEDNEDGRFFTDAINYTTANIQKLEQY